MRAYLTVLAFLAVVVVPVAADEPDNQTASNPATTATTPATDVQKPEDKVVCKLLEPPLGSRIGNRRVCMTQLRWDQQERDAQDAMRRTHSGFAPSN
jgi:hypothetical protein